MTCPATPAIAAALLVLLAASAGGKPVPATDALSNTPRLVLPFINDDYAKAVAQARARKVPLFIEAWAPW